MNASAVADTLLTNAWVAAVTLRSCLRASVPVSATVPWRVRFCTVPRTTTWLPDDVLPLDETA